jgi:hypothetical protein
LRKVKYIATTVPVGRYRKTGAQASATAHGTKAFSNSLFIAQNPDHCFCSVAYILVPFSLHYSLPSCPKLRIHIGLRSQTQLQKTVIDIKPGQRSLISLYFVIVILGNKKT